jgi:hypothetical protein
MTTPIRIKLRLSNTEIELECSLTDMDKVFSQIPKLIQILKKSSLDTSDENNKITVNPSTLDMPPNINIHKSDSLTDVLIKIFQSSWSNNPKKLNEIRETLNSYGLIYPKQTVAVTLLRMAKSGKLRRFKSNTGDYVYTASNSLLSSDVDDNEFDILTN